MFMLNKIYLNLNLNQFSWLLNKHKLYEKLRIRNRGFEIPNHLTKDSNPDSNPMCYISKGFESGFESSSNRIRIRISDSDPSLVTTQRRTLICTGLLGKQGNQHHITGYGNESQQCLQSETVN